MSYIGNQPLYTSYVNDRFSGNGATLAYTLSIAPANSASLLVTIYGVLQDPSAYGVSGNTLTFTSAPPAGSNNISVRYLGLPASNVVTSAYRTVTDIIATAGQTTFSPASYTPGFVDVYRNGAKLATADYTATNGAQVVLANGAAAGDIIQTVGFSVGSVLNAIPANAGSVSSGYLAAGNASTAFLDSGNFNGSGSITIPTGTSSQRPSSSPLGQIRYNTTLGALETTNGSAWVSLGHIGSIGNPATSISQLAAQNFNNGNYTFLISGITFTTYVEFNGPLGKTWVHVGTISDNNEGFQNASAQIWSASLNPTQAAAPWDDASTFGVQSFTTDFKSAGWNAMPFARWLVRDSGATLRNLFYSNVISSANASFRAWWASQTWRAIGSDTASAAVSAGRVTTQAGVSYGVSDPCNIGLRSSLLIKWGEFDGTQDSNKDRAMLSGQNPAGAEGVDSPMGLGCFTGGTAGGPYYRDIVPAANTGDAPPNTISGAPLNYTFWVTD